MSTAVPLQIQIKKPHTFKRHFEFWQNEELVAVLDYQKWFNKLAIVSIKDNQWKIKTSGFWKKHIELTAEQSPYTKIRIDFKWNYRLSFSFDNRQVYYLKPVGFWRRTWAWHDDNDKVVLEIRSNQWSKNNRGKITMHQPPSANLYFLMVLGWYQLLTYEEHSAAAASAGS
jgi:hypothetical protein